jgi:hypothetical protein
MPIMKISLILIFSIFLSPIFFNAQTSEPEFDIYLIDSYVTPEKPNKVVISFITGDSTKSKIIFKNSEEFVVSENFAETHKFEIEFEKLGIIGTKILFDIIAENKAGIIETLENNLIEISEGLKIGDESDSGLFQTCCIGSVIFLFPSASVSISENNSYFGISKELPLFSFYSKGYNYPVGYIGVEYSYFFNAQEKHRLNIGYKHIFTLNYIKFISIGANYSTLFGGRHYFAPELTAGLFQIENVFTVYLRYRYLQPFSANHSKVHFLSIGLYSHFFSLNF